MMVEVGESSRQTLFIWSLTATEGTDQVLPIANAAPVVYMHVQIKLIRVHVAERDTSVQGHHSIPRVLCK